MKNFQKDFWRNKKNPGSNSDIISGSILSGTLGEIRDRVQTWHFVAIFDFFLFDKSSKNPSWFYGGVPGGNPGELSRNFISSCKTHRRSKIVPSAIITQKKSWNNKAQNGFLGLIHNKTHL